MSYVNTFQEPVRNEQLAVGLSNVAVALFRNQDAPRKVILIRNTSPNVADIITVNLGANSAVSGKGIVLRQFESYSDATGEGYECFQGTINAICDTANGQISIMER